MWHNVPLIVSQYTELFVKTEYAYLAVGLIVLILLGVGLCTPKYIGIEGITTLQLIYYSCLLVTDVEKYPVGFYTFLAFKYSTGFNDFFHFTSLVLNDDFTKKVYWMTLTKTSIENYNLSFLPLVIATILMLITFVYRLRAEKKFEARSPKNSKKEICKLQ